jgi:hypothetical protein
MSTQVAQLPSTEKQSIPAYTTQLPAEAYQEIAFLETSGGIFHTKQQLLNKLRQKAELAGADALIAVRFGYQFWWPNVQGTAITLE